MKSSSILTAALCLVAGFLLGSLFPNPALVPQAGVPPAMSILVDTSLAAASTPPKSATPTLNHRDNLSLLNAAYAAARALKDKDYTALSAMVDPMRGVTFTPYSTVDVALDQCLTPAQIKNLAQDQTVYTWGFVDGRGSLIQATIPQYLARYVFDADYTKAPQIGVDQIIMSGNALENLTQAYPGCRFVDFCFPNAEGGTSGLDWSSLKLVFQPGDTTWLLVGIVRGQWTI